MSVQQKNINLAAEYGRTKTYMSSIVGSCIVLSMLVIGGFVTYSAFNTRNNKKKILGEVRGIRPIGKNSYSVDVRYFIDNKEYNNTLNVNNYMVIGTSIEIYYDINNPYNISNSSPTNVIMFGSVVIICAILICCLLIYRIYTVSKYEHAAVESAYSNSSGTYGYGYTPSFQPIIRL